MERAELVRSSYERYRAGGVTRQAKFSEKSFLAAMTFVDLNPVRACESAVDAASWLAVSARFSLQACDGVRQKI